VVCLEFSPGPEDQLPPSVSIRAVSPIWGCTDVALAAVGASFQFTKLASANLREKDDSLNAAIAGFLAGGILGLRGMFNGKYAIE
jgi:hypothetical protein